MAPLAVLRPDGILEPADSLTPNRDQQCTSLGHKRSKTPKYFDFAFAHLRKLAIGNRHQTSMPEHRTRRSSGGGDDSGPPSLRCSRRQPRRKRHDAGAQIAAELSVSKKKTFARRSPTLVPWLGDELHTLRL